MRVLFITDKFDDEYRDEVSKFPGGAELSNEAFIEACPWDLVKIKTGEVQPELLKKFDVHIIGNTKNINKTIIKMLNSLGRHVLIEHDNRICRYDGDFSRARKEPVHYYIHRCICPHLKFQRLYKSGLGTIFHTRRQLVAYQKNPFFYAKNIEILGCAAMNRSFFERVEKFRSVSKKKSGTAVFYSPHSNKGYEQSKNYCLERGIKPIEISDITPDEVLDVFERSEQFVYLPQGIEWAGRMPIEARFLGCKVIVNNNVGVAGEPWWKQDDSESYEFVKDTPDRFWRIVKNFIKNESSD